ncbi:MAG: hypothetical protein HQM04_01590 [Magnetococcales bacterium]|nr:hypothetical protein [Magnetococcales bacterium]MBF0113713.1 hypothetical protein [Magnetococcales bacterium]
MKQSIGVAIVFAFAMSLVANIASAADAPKKVDCKSDKKCEELQKAATKK